MSRSVELEVEIDANGSVKVHVKGAPGAACLEYEQLMERVLGRVTARELTAEYHQQAERGVEEIRHVRRRDES